MEDRNPYQAPHSMLYGRGRAPRLQLGVDPAGKWRRFFNWLLDTAATYFVAMAIGVAAVLIGGDPAAAWLDNLGFWGEQALGMVIMLMYYIPQETAFGFTLGKLITGTRVVNENGEKPSLVQVILRTLSRFIPFEAFSVAFTDPARGWHDSLAKTYVVRKA
ncbi:MAG: RDD family protein [Pseudoxanthomonas sp.]